MTRTLAATIAAALLAASASAQGPSRYLVFVPHADLDLATRAGERQLSARLRVAARQTCGTAAYLHERKRVRQCRATFLDAGRPRIEQALAARADRPMQLAASR